MSAASIWEAAIKASLGTLRLPGSLADATIVTRDPVFARYGVDVLVC